MVCDTTMVPIASRSEIEQYISAFHLERVDRGVLLKEKIR